MLILYIEGLRYIERAERGLTAAPKWPQDWQDGGFCTFIRILQMWGYLYFGKNSMDCLPFIFKHFNII